MESEGPDSRHRQVVEQWDASPVPQQARCLLLGGRTCTESLLKRQEGSWVPDGDSFWAREQPSFNGRAHGSSSWAVVWLALGFWLSSALLVCPFGLPFWGSAADISQATGRPWALGRNHISRTTAVDTQPTAGLEPLSQSSCPQHFRALQGPKTATAQQWAVSGFVLSSHQAIHRLVLAVGILLVLGPWSLAVPLALPLALYPWLYTHEP